MITYLQKCTNQQQQKQLEMKKEQEQQTPPGQFVLWPNQSTNGPGYPIVLGYKGPFWQLPQFWRLIEVHFWTEGEEIYTSQ